MRIDLNDEFVKCRSWGHEWDSFTPLGRRASWGWLLSLRCARCSCERHDTIDATGAVSAREYVYPEGYSLVKDDRPSSEELRLEVLRRLRTTTARGHLRVAR